MSTPGGFVPTTTLSSRRQKRMGPAPFASFEDLSDELDSPDDKNASSVVRLPGIREDVTPLSPLPSSSIIGEGEIRAEFIYTGISLIGAPSTTTMSSQAPTSSSTANNNNSTPKNNHRQSLTPRIDISRASSGSQKDSRESSPEKEAAEDVIKMNTEVVELRRSTEDLDEHELKRRVTSPIGHEETSYQSHNRKDSQSSEIGLLCISGRTSRLSSIGSQGSAQSRISNASHLSVISGQSSRSTSPHKMLVETSFCGDRKKKQGGGDDKDDGTKELEKVLLKRHHDPTQVLIAEGISVTPQNESPKIEAPKEDQRKVPSEEVSSEKVSSEKVPSEKVPSEKVPSQKVPSEKVERKMETSPVEITIKIDKPPANATTDTSDILKPKLPKYIKSANGTEFIYIPLKGPLPEDPSDRNASVKSTTNGVSKGRVRETKSFSHHHQLKDPKSDKEESNDGARKTKSASPSPAMTRHQGDKKPTYIRIKLKPDHMYHDYDPSASQSDQCEKPTTLELDDQRTCQPSPQISLSSKRPNFDEIIALSPQQTPSKPPVASSSRSPNKSPSPSLSRKSSFASLFRSKETISPESPSSLLAVKRKSTNSVESNRRRSKSRDRTVPSSNESINDNINKSTRSVFSLFKGGKKGSSRQELDKHSPSRLAAADPDVSNLASMAQSLGPKKKHPRSPQQCDTIRIPLHSPTYYESDRDLLQDFKTSSQDSQETVIEVKTDKESVPVSGTAVRQSSTSSENIVFSTRLGSSNDLFTTKIPKNTAAIETTTTTTAIVEHVHPDHMIKSPVSKSESQQDGRRDRKLEKAKRVEEPTTHEEATSIDGHKCILHDQYQHVIDELIKDKLTKVGVVNEEGVKETAAKEKADKENVVKEKGFKEKQVKEKLDREKLAKEKEIKEKDFKEKEVTEKLIQEIGVKVKDTMAKETKAIETKAKETMVKETQVKKEMARNEAGISETIKESIKTVHEDFKESRTEIPKSKDSDSETNDRKLLRHYLTSAGSEDIPVIAKEKLKALKAEDRLSSESEREIEPKESKESELQEIEPERKGLVLQQDSFDDELPYVPTTLPQERSMAIPIIPVRQRSSLELKTCPIERPRSTTPNVSANLEAVFREDRTSGKKTTTSQEKLKISLPKSQDEQQQGSSKVKSPRRVSVQSSEESSWFDFSKIQPDQKPPPLPPKGLQKEWINFEEIPEKRKPPKRIQTIPSRGHIEVPEATIQQHYHQQQQQQQQQENVIYTYVNPEDCKCECHERPSSSSATVVASTSSKSPTIPAAKEVDDEEERLREDEVPLLDEDDDDKTQKTDVIGSSADRRSLISDSSMDLSCASVPDPGNQGSAAGVSSLETPFTADLGVSGSNRSSIISQDDQ